MANPGLLNKLLGGDSTLGTNGQTPQVNTVAGENGVENLLADSVLDRNDGNTPEQYKDSAPEGQGGRI